MITFQIPRFKNLSCELGFKFRHVNESNLQFKYRHTIYTVSLRKQNCEKHSKCEAMVTVYEDKRFQTHVDENLHCVICTEVLRGPVQCRRNEHHFCRNCIIEHLKHSEV